MGFTHLFGDESDFSEFSESTKLRFDDIIHTAKLEVDLSYSKSGTATSTSLRSINLMSARADKLLFHCDHPFVFMIRDRVTHEIVFASIYRGPKTN